MGPAAGPFVRAYREAGGGRLAPFSRFLHSDENGNARMLKIGADESTGGVADRWDIDAGAAGGAGFGRVGIMRLDDGAEFYEDIAPDE